MQSGNAHSGTSGRLYNLGTVTLQECTLSANTATSAGGSISNGAPGVLTIDDSTVFNNVAPSGADLYNLGAGTLNDTTVGVLGP
jgi:hypothetical protein